MAGTRFSPAGILLTIAVACFSAVALALVSQHLFGMQPCPWCVLQRLIFVVAGTVALLGAVLQQAVARLAAAGLVLLLALSGVAAAAWQHFKAAASTSCNLTLADKIIGALHLDSLLPDIFAPRASCAAAAVRLFGVPYDFWSLGLFALSAIGAIMVIGRFRMPNR